MEINTEVRSWLEKRMRETRRSGSASHAMAVMIARAEVGRRLPCDRGDFRPIAIGRKTTSDFNSFCYVTGCLHALRPDLQCGRSRQGSAEYAPAISSLGRQSNFN